MSAKRIFLLFCLLVGLSSFGIVQDGVKVLTLQKKGLAEGFRKARHDNKLLFILVTSKDCKACKQLEAGLQKGGSYVDFYEEHFYCFKVMADDIYHQARLQGWGVSKVPSLLYMNGDKKVVHIAEGYDNTSGFQYEAEKALSKAAEMNSADNK